MKFCNKEAAFDNLIRQVQSCEKCPRLKGRTRVLSERNGSLDAQVLFVAEAPGRLGADQTGIVPSEPAGLQHSSQLNRTARRFPHSPQSIGQFVTDKRTVFFRDTEA